MSVVDMCMLVQNSQVEATPSLEDDFSIQQTFRNSNLYAIIGSVQ